MVRNTIKITAYTLTAVLAFGGMGMTAQADGESVLPGGGATLALSNANKLEDITTDMSTMPIESAVEWSQVEKELIPLAEPEPTEEDLFRNLVIAQVDHYVNVRSLPSEEGEVLGKLYNNSVGTFISEENGWYQITSGSVTGYVKGEYCVTGEAAVEIAKQVGKRIATVTTETLFVRTEPSTDCSIMGMVPEADDLLVLEETEGWVKVDVEEGTGWVSAEYVALHSEFVQAESKEEEERRLAKEEEERRKAREAAARRAAQNTQNTQSEDGEGNTQEEAPQTYDVSGSAICSSVCRGPLCMGRYQPDKRRRLLRVCNERICKLRRGSASFFIGGSLPGVCGGRIGKCTAGRSDLLFGTCGSVHRQRPDRTRFQSGYGNHRIRCGIQKYPGHQENFLKELLE